MASIISENYCWKNAEPAPQTGKGWNVADRIFGYVDSGVNSYNKLRAGAYTLDENGRRIPEIGIFGMQRPYGGILLFVGIGIVAFGLYKIATK